MELPETCIDDPDLYGTPPEKALRLAWQMAKLAEPVALFCMIAPRYLRRPDLINSTVIDLHHLEQFAAANNLELALQQSEVVGALITALLDEHRESKLSRSKRYRIAASLVLLIRLLRRYLRIQQRSDNLSLRRLMPVDPLRIKDALGLLNERRKSFVVAFRASRKARVHCHAGRLSQLEFASDLNLEQVVLTSRALKDAESDLGEQDWIDVPVLLTIVDARGRLRLGKQQCIWRVWREDAYVKQVLSGTRDKDERRRLQEQLDALKGEAAGFIHEYRRTIGVLGSTPIEPFMIRCWRHGLMVNPTYLPARVRRRRHAVLRELSLPGCNRGEQGLLYGTVNEMDLWRISLRQNRTIVFITPFEHALRFAHLGVTSVLENMSRTTAWMQQTQDQTGWAIRRLNKQDVAGFLAHDKVSRNKDLPDEMSWFPVGPKHLVAAAELAAMTCARCGYADGLLPEIKHAPSMLWKRPEPAAWLFSFDGRIVGPGSMGRFLRFLLPGQGYISYYDFRHLMANAALAAGTPGWIIRLALNHGSSDLWMYYAQQSARQIATIESTSHRAIVERSADARNKRAA
jgi:hypothetical protein